MLVRVLIFVVLLGSSSGRATATDYSVALDGCELSLAQLVRSLNQRHELNFNIYIWAKAQQQPAHEELARLNVSKLLISDVRSSKKIEHRFTELLLLVAHIEAASAERVTSMVQHILWKTSKAKVLYVGDNMALRLIREVFRASWEFGQRQVVMLHNRSLIFVNPIRTDAQLQQLHRLQDVFSLGYTQNYYGASLHFIMRNDVPRGYRHNNRYQGYFYDIVAMFADFLNGTLMDLMPSYAQNDDRLIVAQLYARAVDIAPTFLHYSHVYDASQPIEHKRIIVAVPYENRLSRYNYLTLPFEPALWRLLLMLMAVAVCVQVLSEGLLYGSWDVSGAVLHILQRLLYVGTSPRRRCSVSQICLCLSLYAWGFIGIGLYVSSLSSIFIWQPYVPIISSLDGIVGTNLSVICSSNDMPILRRQLNIAPEVFQHFVSTNISTMEKLLNNWDASNIYVGVKDKLQFFFERQKLMSRPLFKEFKLIFGQVPLFIPMPPSSPLTPLLNTFLLYLREFGILKKIFQQNIRKAFTHGTHGVDSRQMQKSLHLNRLNIAHVHFSFFILIAGLLLSLITWLCEFCFAWAKRRFNRRVQQLQRKPTLKFVYSKD